MSVWHTCAVFSLVLKIKYSGGCVEGTAGWIHNIVMGTCKLSNVAMAGTATAYRTCANFIVL